MPHTPVSFDRTRLDPVIGPIARAHGAEVMDVEFKSEQGGWVLRVFVEKLGSAERNASTKDAAVDLNTCANIARDLSPALDVVDFASHRYNLEVSTPGVERPLRSEQDFRRFRGEKARVKLERPVSGQKVVIGILGEVKDGKCSVVDGSRTYEFEVAEVETARLVFEFGKAEKPGGPSSKRGAPNSKRARELQAQARTNETSPESSPALQSTGAEPPPSSKRVPR
jgi:ribosome maturation factor RimP